MQGLDTHRAPFYFTAYSDIPSLKSGSQIIVLNYNVYILRYQKAEDD
jgi:hypothetical protein